MTQRGDDRHGSAPTSRPPGPPRMRRPGGRLHYAALTVVDLDTDSGAVVAHRQWTQGGPAAEGVHALVWHHGEPVGELTLAGSPEIAIARLHDVARQELARPLLEHDIRDALAAGIPSAGGSTGIQHPPSIEPDGGAVTVAICTRDRPEQLRACLASVAGLRSSVGEVLVVDNAPSNSRTRQVVDDYDFARYVLEPRRGLSWARNRALLEATTPVVAFTDDDALVHPRWVDGLLRAFDEEPDAIIVTGLVAPAELATPAQVLFEGEGGFGRGYSRRYFCASDWAATKRERNWIGDAGTGANMAVLRGPVCELGGFDVALGAGTPAAGAEDLDLLFRAVSRGMLVVYEPTAVVRHRHRPTMDGLVRQRQADGTGTFSWLLGAVRRYGTPESRAFLRSAVPAGLLRHVRGTARSIAWPRLWPPRLPLAEARGAYYAIFAPLYRRGIAQARKQVTRYPAEPVLAMDGTTCGRRKTRMASATVQMDLDLDEMRPEVLLPDDDACGVVEVNVVKRGAPPLRFTLRTDGCGLSAARLRWELSARLVEHP